MISEFVLLLADLFYIERFRVCQFLDQILQILCNSGESDSESGMAENAHSQLKCLAELGISSSS